MRPDTQLLIQEANSLILRVREMRPFEMRMTMVPAAALSGQASFAILKHVRQMRSDLTFALRRFIDWAAKGEGRGLPLDRLQQRFTAIKMRFVASLTAYDIFSDVSVQRSERDNGVWLAGLDAVAEDALRLPHGFDSPPVVCYLERGVGAAIRRAKTPLPGGGRNPVAIIRVPRERMVGFGISSSLVHEVGHQAEMLLGLSDELKPVLKRAADAATGPERLRRSCFHQWISEILADAWGVSLLGIAAPRGLMSVLSLPRPFLFRMKQGDPHPMPWIRTKICLALGDALYPHPQWKKWNGTWQRMHPIPERSAALNSPVRILEAGIVPFVEMLLSFRPRSLKGMSIRDLLRKPERHPEALRLELVRFKKNPKSLAQSAPTHALAVLGQGFADQSIDSKTDSRTIADLLTQWAFVKNTGEPLRFAGNHLHAPTRQTNAAALL